ncbi:YaiI/YqxD family protein [Thalassobacillus hwangdonensis]|uniref:UPF0178 protein ACFQ2J_06205 n=1 Tax=Thalassobacillus hwangdonensis TaxID=546108 RepID=A0ABW3L0C1_9BACI
MLKNQKPIVYVDADSCPVKEEIQRVCQKHVVTPVFVSTFNHYSPDADNDNWRIIDPDDQAVDLYILNKVEKGDLVITQDLSFAVLLMGQGVYALTPRGKLIAEADADEILYRKYLRQKNQKARNRIKGPSALTDEDKKRFEMQLENFLSNNEGIF